MDAVSKWCRENELILNLKKGKTEMMIFGTSQKLKKLTSPIKIYFNNQLIKTTEQYNYLGSLLDCSLNFNKNFDRAYKKCSSRLRLLMKIRQFIDTFTAKTIHRSMVMPVMTYCGVMNLNLYHTYRLKLQSLDRRSNVIVNAFSLKNVQLQSIENYNKKRACLLVSKILNDNCCNAFRGYFDVFDNERQTRNNKSLIRLPKVRTEFGRKSFYFFAARTFNALPCNIRNDYRNADFKTHLNLHFA